MPFAYQPLMTSGPVEVIVTLNRKLGYAGACERAREECLKLQSPIIGFRLWKELGTRKGYALHEVPYIFGKSDRPIRRVPSLEEARVVL